MAARVVSAAAVTNCYRKLAKQRAWVGYPAKPKAVPKPPAVGKTKVAAPPGVAKVAPKKVAAKKVSAKRSPQAARAAAAAAKQAALVKNLQRCQQKSKALAPKTAGCAVCQ